MNLGLFLCKKKSGFFVVVVDILMGFKAGQFVSSYAERKSKVMKWLTKIFKGGSCNRGSPRGRQPQFLEDENMVWRAPVGSLVGVIFLTFHFEFRNFGCFRSQILLVMTQSFALSLFLTSD